ncbi:MAG: OmpH family outer membrane protein [Bacteroidales bacterium]|nr:OmpH family outer membrane protein [Bacteroidales bacterium]
MKNLSYILNGILAAGILVVYLLLRNDIKQIEPEQKKQVRKVAKVPSDISDFPTSDMVYVNVDSLLLQYEYYKETVMPLEAKMQGVEMDFNKEVQVLQNEYAQEMQAYNQGLRTTKTMEETAQKLEQKKNALDIKYQGKADELSRQYDAALEKVQKDIKTYLENLANIKNYKYVINGSLFWYANQENNITTTTLNDLNKQYAASK